MDEIGRYELREWFERSWSKPPEERSAFLQQECADESIRAEVEQLLAAYEEGSGYFKSLDALRYYLDDLDRGVRQGVKQDSAIDPYGLVEQTVSYYKIKSVIGAGGMGVVYEAYDPRLERVVALKLLPPAYSHDEGARRRLLNEARVASSLDHPNVLTILDIGEAHGLLFIAMAFCEGETLAERLSRGPLPQAEALDIAMQVGRGLAAAHRKGIVHRDIKPANIIITPQGLVKIVDFGLAKLADLGITRTGQIVGSPAHMSPEQVRGDEVDHRSDLWALGTVLYEMLAGKPAFAGDYPHAILYSVLYDDPDWYALGEAPRPLKELISSMLTINRDDRMSSADAAVSAMQQISSARSTTTGGRTSLALLFRYGVAAAVLILLLLLVFSPIFSGAGVELSPGAYVLVSEFENSTQEPVLDHSIAEALRVSLRQSPHVNLFPSQSVAAALTRMRLPAGHRLDLQTAIELARREGIPVVLGGSIDRLGNEFVVTCRLVNASTGESLRIRHVVVDRIEDVLGKVDRLYREIRLDLGESLALIESSAALDHVTTSSIEALELFSEANALVQEAKVEDAVRLLEAAVELDSMFAAAMDRLAMHYRQLGRYDKAVYYHERLLPLLDRVTDEERFMILTNFYGQRFEMDYDRAFEHAREWAVRYPNNADAFAWLGHLAMFVGDTETAIRSNQRASLLNPAYAGIMLANSAFAQALEGHADAALGLFRSSERLEVDSVLLSGFIAQSHWLRADFDSAESELNSILPEGGTLRKKKTHALLAALHLFRGQLGRASKHVEAGLAECKRTSSLDQESYFHVLAAEIAIGRGDLTAARTALQQAARLSQSPHLDLALAGARLADIGSTAEARDALSRLRGATSRDPYFTRRKASMEHYMAGAIFYASDQPDDAKTEFVEVEEMYRGDPIYLLALRRSADLLSQAQSDSGVKEYQALLYRRGEAVMAFLPVMRDGGIWTSRLWPEVHLELGRIYSRRNEHRLAMRHLMAAAEIWNEADSDYLPAGEARSLLSQLRTAITQEPNAIASQTRTVR